MGFKYEDARKLETRDAHFRYIDEFARTYKKGRPTIVLLPGGMGSQLDRTTKPFRGRASLPFKRYDPVWIDLGILFDLEIKQLEILANGHDKDNHICIPNGPLRFLIKPYNATESYFRAKDYNFIVFAYDWRRSVIESAGYLKSFLKRLKSRVMQLRDEDPLPSTTLLCHSMGGLVAKVYLHQVFKKNTTPGDVRNKMARVITVATPFYGTATHMQRYWKGEEPLNLLYGKKTLARITGTFEGPYIFLFLDKQTYDRHAANLEINRYPVRDANNVNITADPYDPNFFNRYPPWVNRVFLHKAMDLHKTIAKYLPAAVVDRVFHIRAVKRRTQVEHKWQSVNGANFNPNTDPSPISGTMGDGDGTIPAWSARLAQVPDSQVFNLETAKSHSDLLEHEETLEVVNQLMETDQLPSPLTIPTRSLIGPKVTGRTVRNFIADVAANRVQRTDARATDKRMWRQIVEEINLC